MLETPVGHEKSSTCEDMSRHNDAYVQCRYNVLHLCML